MGRGFLLCIASGKNHVTQIMNDHDQEIRDTYREAHSDGVIAGLVMGIILGLIISLHII